MKQIHTFTLSFILGLLFCPLFLAQESSALPAIIIKEFKSETPYKDDNDLFAKVQAIFGEDYITGKAVDYDFKVLKPAGCDNLPAGVALVSGRIVGTPLEDGANKVCFILNLRSKQLNKDFYVEIHARKIPDKAQGNPQPDDAKTSASGKPEKVLNRSQPKSTDSADKGSDVKTKASLDSDITTPADGTPSKSDSLDNSLDNKHTRALVGIEQVGSSAESTESKPFVDFFFSSDVFSSKSKKTFAAWGNVRITSTPSFISSLGVFPGSGLADKSFSGKGNIQGFEFLAGGEFKLTDKFALTFSGGGISPFVPTTESVNIVRVPAMKSAQFATFKERFPDAITSGKPYVAFTFPERNRLLRQYYAGIRLRSFKNGDVFPDMFDVMIGQNEAVTGGKRVGPVLRLDGAYRLPLLGKYLFLFGNASFHFAGKEEAKTPLFLQAAPSEVNVFNNDVFVVPDRQKSRDIFKIGIGINLPRLFDQTKNTDKPKPADDNK